MRAIVVFWVLALSQGQNQPNKATVQPEDSIERAYQSQLSEKIGNFSLELLHHAAKSVNSSNFIMSPITAWTILAVISEGSEGNTQRELNEALRTSLSSRNATRIAYRNIARLLAANTSTIELAKSNAIFVDESVQPELDFQRSAKQFYDTLMVPLNFRDAAKTARVINEEISRITHGRILQVVDESSITDSKMVVTSAIYFRGKWTAPFKAENTKIMPFYDQNNRIIGKVNMMYSRYNYPFANIRELESRVIEIPYGVENRFSMLIILPNPGISVEDNFKNILKVSIQTVINQLNISRIEYEEEKVDCFIPRFKIESKFELNEILQTKFHIKDLFDSKYASLPHMSRVPSYVTKVIHKAEIEVTEEGTTASAVSTAEIAERIVGVRFVANRPFTYVIIEKITSSIVFGGIYKKPTVY